ncbi:MAG: hypothetical protein QW840_02545 [Candidatus Bathyarchaeia archaeon]
MSEKQAFIMMIQPKWWNEFRNRCIEGKTVHSYVHRGLAGPKNASMIIFYAAKPIGKVVGYAEFVERKIGAPKELWEMHGDESVLRSRESFESFVKGKSKIAFVRMRSLHEAANPIELNTLLSFLGKKRLGRGGFFVNSETASKLIALMG